MHRTHSWQYFPPVYQTAERSANSRVLVLDQETLEVIDEYNQPADKDARWTCMAGLAFSEEGMGVSMFHGAAIAMVDWKAGLSDEVAGVGSNDLGRAWGYDEDGTIYVTDRERSRDCLQGEVAWMGSETPCGPPVFRQKVQVIDLGSDSPNRTIGLDPGVNVIAGIRPNRMSAVACANIGGPNANGEGTSCDVETLLIAASAFNPSMNADGGRMKPGGGVGEYSIDPADADGANGPCTGAHGPANAADNVGCAQPIAQFLGRTPSICTGSDLVDPRMLMVIHEAFVQ
jgi:hypothetical protein